MGKIKRIFKPQKFALRIKRSRTGLGLFAEETIPKGVCVIEYTGRPVSKEEQERNQGKYFFWTGRGTMIDGNSKENTARYINHSCAPNCEVDLYRHRIYIFARKNIKSGEELNYDYGTEYFDMHIKPKGCLCKKCVPI